MRQQIIRCPRCGNEFVIGEAIIKEIVEEELKRQTQLAFEQGKATARLELEEELRKTQANIELLQEALKAKDKKIEELSAQEIELRRRQRELEERERSLQLELERKIDAERQKLEKELQAKYEEQYKAEKQLLEERLKAEEEKLKAKYEEEYRLEIKMKDMQIEKTKKQAEELQKQIEELQRKLEQGSQQLQGEVLELDIEELLKRCFPQDKIESIPQGKAGADIVQTVLDDFGRECGKILWECKRTKEWNKEWIAKLKEDQRRIGAEIAVIASTAMPKDVDAFTNIDGVWVVKHGIAQIVATLLRNTLKEVTREKTIQKTKHETKEVLFNYLTSTQFKQRAERLIGLFLEMKNDLDKERAEFLKSLSKREQRLNQLIENASAIYGEIEAITQALPDVRINIKMISSPESKS